MTQPADPRPGVLLKQLEPASRVDEVADRFVTALAIGEYLPGTRLPSERELADSLGVSRMTVRAALARLVDDGLLETRRGRGGGSYVLQQWPESSTAVVGRSLAARFDELRDRCDAIARLHGAICRAAAETHTDADAATLTARLDDYRRAASGPESQRADSRLHLAIIDAAHNDTLRRILAGLEASVGTGTGMHMWGEPDRWEEMERRALGEHRALVAAITERRGDAADELARRHLAIDFEHIQAAMSHAGISPTTKRRTARAPGGPR